MSSHLIFMTWGTLLFEFAAYSMVVGHGVSEAQEKRQWKLYGLLNYFLWWTCFVEKSVIEHEPRKPPAPVELEAVSYSRTPSSGHL